MRKVLVFLLFYLFNTSSFAQFAIQNRGLVTQKVTLSNGIADEVIPLNVKDNSAYFRPFITPQNYGSCYIHAAVANVEASMKKYCPNLSGEVNIDELYYIYAFLKLYNQNPNTTLDTKPDKAFQNLFGAVTGEKKDEFGLEFVYRFALGQYGGAKENSKNEPVICIESQTRSPLETQKNLKELEIIEKEINNIYKTILDKNKIQFCEKPKASNLIDKKVADEIKSLTCEKIDQTADSRCWFPTTDSEKVKSQTTNLVSKPLPNFKLFKGITPLNSEISQCLKRLKFTKISEFTHEKAKKILDSGGFFSCAGDFTDINGNIYNNVKGYNFGHVLNVVGYQENPETKEIEYLVRDSNYPKDTVAPYTVGGCSRMFYIEPVSEIIPHKFPANSVKK